MMVYPPPLAAGSVLRVVAPASPFDVTLLYRGLGWLAERYRVRFDRGIFARHGYLAGDDQRRREELGAALVEPDVAAIVCARGGYGVSRFAHLIEWNDLRRRPRWLVGFSDNTALHVEASRAGVASLHGPHVTGLGRGDAVQRAAFVRALEHPRAPRRYPLTEQLAGTAEGELFVANLALLHACAAAGRLRLERGTILVIEDIGERPFRVDRMLTTLIVGGHLASVVGVVLGEFSHCGAGPDGVSVADVARELLAPLAIPLASGAPVGHGVYNEPLVVGAAARLRVGDGAELVVGDGG